MNANPRSTLGWIVVLSTLAACSQGAAPPQSSAATNPASTPAAQSSTSSSGKALGNPCDVLTVADVAGIFAAPVHRRLDDWGKDKCIYNSDAGAKLTITTSKDDDRKSGWDVYRRMMVPRAGLGDEALQDPDGTTVIAGQGDIDCMVELQGIGDSSAEATITKDRGEALARRLGALCSKLFSGH